MTFSLFTVFDRFLQAPDPAMVRPQKVLEKSLAMVKQKWKSKPDYYFTCEQLKAIRQDLTVNNIIVDNYFISFNEIS